MRNYCLTILTLFGIHTLCIAQVKNYDSLLQLANTTSVDTMRVTWLNDASVALRETDTKRALDIAEQAKELSDKINFAHGRAMVLANVGWINYRKGVYSEALSLSKEALKIHQQLRDQVGIVNCLNNIGAVSFEQQKYQGALASFKKAYQTARQVKYRDGMSRSLNNISYCFLRLKQLDSARYYTMRSIDEHVNDKYRTSFSKRQLGDIAFEEKKFLEAMHHYQECLAGATAQNNNFLLASTQYRLARTFLKLNNPDKALELLNKNIALAKKYNYKSELEATYLTTSDVYAIKNDMARAMQYQSLHYQLKDSLSEQRRGELISMVERQSESEIKNAQIELLTKDALLRKNELKTQRNLIYMGIGILVVLTVLIINLLYGIQRNNRANRLLAERNQLINQQANQLVNLNNTKDKILSIIGHDMRSPLAGLKGLVSLMDSDSITQKEFIDNSKSLRKNLDYVYNDLDNLLQWANAQLTGIIPQFSDVCLSEIVNEKASLFDEVAKAKSIQISLNVPASIFARVDINHLRLALRNLISNAIKFSRPQTTITISASEISKKVFLKVQDQGVGISPEDQKKLFNAESHFTRSGTQNEKGVGLGLILVKEFMETNRGSISVSSKINEGTIFIVTLEGFSTEPISTDRV
jgi:two-component system, sensor histidine kinase and response regulator